MEGGSVRKASENRSATCLAPLLCQLSGFGHFFPFEKTELERTAFMMKRIAMSHSISGTNADAIAASPKIKRFA